MVSTTTLTSKSLYCIQVERLARCRRNRLQPLVGTLLLSKSRVLSMIASNLQSRRSAILSFERIARCHQQTQSTLEDFYRRSFTTSLELARGRLKRGKHRNLSGLLSQVETLETSLLDCLPNGWDCRLSGLSLQRMSTTLYRSTSRQGLMFLVQQSRLFPTRWTSATQATSRE